MEKCCVVVNLSNDKYSPLIILAAGGQQDTDSLFNLEFACEVRCLVCLRHLCFGCLRQWPKVESVLNSDEGSLSVLVVSGVGKGMQ